MDLTKRCGVTRKNCRPQSAATKPGDSRRQFRACLLSKRDDNKTSMTQLFIKINKLEYVLLSRWQIAFSRVLGPHESGPWIFFAVQVTTQPKHQY